MCAAVCFRCQCELLGLLGGIVSCLFFQVAMCGFLCFASFRWQSELYVLGCNGCCCLF